MSLVKWFAAIWIVSIPILTLISEKYNPTTHARTFCAYNRIFVEFEEGPFKWGTLMLDLNGRPIPCSESDPVDVPVNTKEII